MHSFSNPYELNLHMADVLKDLASPLLDQYLPGGDMGYLRLYPDGTSLRLAADPYWTKEFYTKKYYNNKTHKIYGFEHVDKANNYSLITGVPTGEVAEAFFHKAKLWNQFLIHRYTPDYIDFFSVTSASDDTNAPSFYFNNLLMLERYRDDFINRMGSILDTPHKNTLIHSISKDEIRTLFADMSSHRNRPRRTLIPGVELSQREYECLKYISMGKPAKEVARVLGISPKTVEGHLENIRFKSGLCTRSQLIQAFFEGPLARVQILA